MKRVLPLLLCLVLVGCSRTSPAVTRAAGLTIEEHALGGDGRLEEAIKVIHDRPEIVARRKPLRDAPRVSAETAPIPPLPDGTGAIREGRAIRAGDGWVYLRYNEAMEIEVVAGDRILYTYTHPQRRHVTSPDYLVQGFTTWEGEWVLETLDEKVIVGGRSLGERLGLGAIFGFRLIGGKPFFFFRENGKVKVSCDGQALPVQYDQVPHYGDCAWELCKLYDTNDQIVSFYALRDGAWYFVDMGLFK